MEIVSIEKKTFEEMKERFGSFSQHVRELCARYRPPEKMNWMDGADVCEKLGISTPGPASCLACSAKAFFPL